MDSLVNFFSRLFVTKEEPSGQLYAYLMNSAYEKWSADEINNGNQPYLHVFLYEYGTPSIISHSQFKMIKGETPLFKWVKIEKGYSVRYNMNYYQDVNELINR
jgi:hypothetical protein